MAYAYGSYPKARYRDVFRTLESAYDIRFIFADERITNMHIMAKIIGYIREAEFSVFDITDWNPNVTLELGIAMALNENWYIAINPAKTAGHDVPSDLGGLDRIQYETLDAFGKQLARVLVQRGVRARPKELLAEPLLMAGIPAKRGVELDLRVPNRAGAIDKLLRRLRLAKVKIKYMYVVKRTATHTTFALGVGNARSASKALGRR